MARRKPTRTIEQIMACSDYDDLAADTAGEIMDTLLGDEDVGGWEGKVKAALYAFGEKAARLYLSERGKRGGKAGLGTPKARTAARIAAEDRRQREKLRKQVGRDLEKVLRQMRRLGIDADDKARVCGQHCA